MVVRSDGRLGTSMRAPGKILGRLLRLGGAMSEAVIVDTVRTPIASAPKWIYDFDEGSRDMRELLGGKGSGIAEMTRVLGPDLVPAGFTITTEACVEYMRASRVPPEGLADAIAEALTRLEERADKHLGDPDDPLLVSVRSGARDSMPGVMEW